MNRQRMRPLGLRNQGLGHPFRQSLPIEIVQITRAERDLDAAAKAKGRGEDVSLFLLSFLAFFTAFYMFIF